MRKAAAITSACLSALFLLVYGGCSWITAQRADVPSWYFEWERGIPFVPAMVVPYLSLDLFFVVAPFICRDRSVLTAYARRITFAIVGAGLCFLAFPLQFAFERPAAGPGFVGALFDSFRALDRPFNLFPSLHVALCVIVGETYVRHTRGAIRLMLIVWFVLISLSTLFTYQHHVVDIGGGLALAAAAWWWAPGDMLLPGGRQAGVRYALGAIGCVLLAATAGWWSLPFLWPAASLAIAAAAYFNAGPGVFCKTGGRIAPGMRVLLAPYLCGQWLSLRWYSRQCHPWDAVTPHVWIGRALSEHEASAAAKAGVTAVLDLTTEFSERQAFRRLAYRNIQVLDLTAPSLEQLDNATHFIADHASRGIVYVHCKAGYSRSAAASGAYLLAVGAARDADDCVRLLRKARPSIVVRPEVLTVLREFAARTESARSPVVLRSSVDRFVAELLAAIARATCGVSARWLGSLPDGKPRIYYANHSSHLDFVALWASLPPETRQRTVPVAAREYWQAGRIRRYVAERVFAAVLVERQESDGASMRARVARAQRSVGHAVDALAANHSLIVFPEGTRRSQGIGAFKSGLYYVCRMRPDVEIVPVYLRNLDRILPKGAMLPVPLRASVTFGSPIRLGPGEEKDAFLARAREALVRIGSCHESAA